MRRQMDRGVGAEAGWLSASEVGSFGFCPRAWYLERLAVPVVAEAAERRRAGRRTHRQIGRASDALRAVALLCRLLFALAFGLLLLVALLVLLGRN